MPKYEAVQSENGKWCIMYVGDDPDKSPYYVKLAEVPTYYQNQKAIATAIVEGLTKNKKLQLTPII